MFAQIGHKFLTIYIIYTPKNTICQIVDLFLNIEKVLIISNILINIIKLAEVTEKILIIGITACRSECQDKKIWHKRWRARERTRLTSIPFQNFDAYPPVSEKEVSNPWQMGKDGKQYRSIKNQAIIAERTAQNKGQTPKEKLSIKQRQIHKSMNK